MPLPQMDVLYAQTCFFVEGAGGLGLFHFFCGVFGYIWSTAGSSMSVTVPWRMLVFISNLLKVVYDIKELVDSAQNRKLELRFDYHTQIP